MHAKLVDKLRELKEWEYEPKLDGYRVVVLKNERTTILSRRNNMSWTDLAPQDALTSAFSARPFQSAAVGLRC